MTLSPNNGPRGTQVTVSGKYPFRHPHPVKVDLWFINEKTNRFEHVGSVTFTHCPCFYRTQATVPNDAPLGKTQFALAEPIIGVASADFTVTFGSMKLQPAFGSPLQRRYRRLPTLPARTANRAGLSSISVSATRSPPSSA
jgi:hypothetical protein